MDFKTSARTKTMTRSDLEVCLFITATRAWLSIWNVIFLLANLSPQMMTDKTTGINSKKVMSWDPSMYFQCLMLMFNAPQPSSTDPELSVKKLIKGLI